MPILYVDRHVERSTAVEHDCLQPVSIEEEAMRSEAPCKHHDFSICAVANLPFMKAVSRLRNS